MITKFTKLTQLMYSSVSQIVLSVLRLQLYYKIMVRYNIQGSTISNDLDLFHSRILIVLLIWLDSCMLQVRLGSNLCKMVSFPFFLKHSYYS